MIGIPTTSLATPRRLARRRLLAAGATLLGTIAAGCGASPAASTPTPAPAAPAAPATTKPAVPAAAPTTAATAVPAAKPAASKTVALKYLWVTRPGEEELWKETYPRLLAQYHPHIQPAIETVPASGDIWAQLLTKAVSMTAAGAPPDVSRNAGYNARQLDKQGLFRNIMDYARSEQYPFDRHFTSAFPPHLKPADGRLMGLPVSILTVVRYVNKDLLAKAGLTAPSDWEKAWSFEQMRDAAKQLSQGEGAQRIFGAHMLMNGMHGSHWFWGNGAEIIDPQGNVRINEPIAIETLEYGLEFYKQMWSPAPTDIQSVPLVQMFNTGRVGMLEFSQSSVPTIARGAKFDWGVMPTSIGKSGKAHAVQFVDFWYVHAKSAHPEDGYRAIEVLNREEFETAMAQAKTGGVPTLKSVADKFGKELLQNDSHVSLASLDRSREPYYAVNHLEWQRVVNTNMELLWLGKITTKECAENIVKQAEPVLAADKGA